MSVVYYGTEKIENVSSLEGIITGFLTDSANGTDFLTNGADGLWGTLNDGSFNPTLTIDSLKPGPVGLLSTAFTFYTSDDTCLTSAPMGPISAIC